MKYVSILMLLLSLPTMALAASEYAMVTFRGTVIRYIDKSGPRDDGGKPDLFVELSGEEAKRAKSPESFVLVLNGLSKKGWEVVHVLGNPGDEPTYFLRREVGNAAAAAPAAPAAAPTALPSVAPAAPRKAATEGERIPLTFTGGYETDERDRGRPVILIASALGVTSEIFRDAFSKVTPSRNGPPDRELAQRNKQVLMDALGKHGITNERLDEVSNYYRYHRPEQDLWKHRPAAGFATVKDGIVTSVTITEPGAGYSSTPQVTVPGAKQPLTASVWYGADLAKNGSIKEVTIGK